MAKVSRSMSNTTRRDTVLVNRRPMRTGLVQSADRI